MFHVFFTRFIIPLNNKIISKSQCFFVLIITHKVTSNPQKNLKRSIFSKYWKWLTGEWVAKREQQRF